MNFGRQVKVLVILSQHIGPMNLYQIFPSLFITWTRGLSFMLPLYLYAHSKYSGYLQCLELSIQPGLGSVYRLN